MNQEIIKKQKYFTARRGKASTEEPNPLMKYKNSVPKSEQEKDADLEKNFQAMDLEMPAGLTDEQRENKPQELSIKKKRRFENLPDFEYEEELNKDRILDVRLDADDEALPIKKKKVKLNPDREQENLSAQNNKNTKKANLGADD